MLNEAPQEQPCSAKGLLTTRKADLINSVWNSIVAPFRYCREVSSTITDTPSLLNTRSPSSAGESSSKVYWNPEQPPPSTPTRREVFVPSSRRREIQLSLIVIPTELSLDADGSDSPALDDEYLKTKIKVRRGMIKIAVRKFKFSRAFRALSRK